MSSRLDCVYGGMLEVNEIIEMNSRVATRTLRSGIAMDIGGSRERWEEDGAVNEAVARLQTRYVYRFAKRFFDIVFSLFVLIAFSWLFLIIGLAIKIDDPNGPIVFKQERVTKDGKKFNMYKFRSMCSDAEERLADLREFNEKTGPVFKMHNDPRITRVGRVIRKLSLDEIMQFVNVLKGDIPLRILKTRPEFSEESMVRSRFPPNLARTKERCFRRS